MRTHTETAKQRSSTLLSRLNNMRKHGGLYNIVVYILLIDLAFIFSYPFIYMLVTSFKSYNDLVDVTVKWYPKEFSPENWKTAFESLNFAQTFSNSAVVTILSTLGHILSCSFIAYGFARFRFPLKNVMFFGVLLTIIVPIQSVIIPQYRLYSQMGMLDSYIPLILPTFLGFGLRGGLFIFLFRQFFLRLPPALEEAAEIDGANPYMTYFKIIIPTGGPVLLVCLVLSIVWHWNDFYEPSLYLTSSDKWLLPQSLPAMYDKIKSLGENSIGDIGIFMQQTYHEGVAMAGTAIAVLPLLIMYLFLQDKFMESIDRTGLVE